MTHDPRLPRTGAGDRPVDCSFRVERSSVLCKVDYSTISRASRVLGTLLSSHPKGLGVGNPVVLRSLTEDALRDGIGRVYGTPIPDDVDFTAALDLWEFGTRFEIPVLAAEAEALAFRSVSVQEFHLYMRARGRLESSVTDGDICDFLARNLGGVSGTRWYGSMCFETLRVVLQQPYVKARPAVALAAVIRWAERDLPGRLGKWKTLLGYIDMDLLPVKYLSAVLLGSPERF